MIAFGLSIATVGLVFTLVWFMLLARNKQRLAKRLQSALKTPSRAVYEAAKEKKKKAVQQSVLRLLGLWGGKQVEKLLPAKRLTQIQTKLSQAGMYNMKLSEFVGIKLLSSLVVFLISFLFLDYHKFSTNLVLYPCVGLFLGFYLPDFWLNAQIRKRHQEIQALLPFTLDIIKICIEAGLDLNGALARVVQKVKGPLSDEFARLLYEVRMGKERTKALESLAKRVSLAELTSFTTIVIQAEKYGMSIGQIIDSQADQMRVVRSQRIREKAAKVPVLMLAPIVMFIFPTMFLILLGPAALKVMGM